MPLWLSAEHQHVFQKRKKKQGKKKNIACKTAPYSLLPCAILVGVWMLRKPQGRAAKDEENNIYMRQQQVSTLQIRALGALCRVLSQVWRRRIALAIPRLQKVWTKYAANLFCAELEGEGEKKKQEHVLVLRVSHLLCGFSLQCAIQHFWLLFFLFHQCWKKKKFLTRLQHMLSEVNQNTYVLVQMVISYRAVSDIESTANHQTRHQKENPSNPTSSIKSQGQRESVSIGTGMTDLGGIGKTNSKQVYYIWRAIFTASTKRTQKVLYLTIWDQ